ncbi:AmmeMemoRadiSam system radical SAM enzyme [bacterium]|nr:AmmeMemoRadiSam system radical SAM enzyme [bacterium]
MKNKIQSIPDYKIANWWQLIDNHRVKCHLCPRFCKIPKGSHGFCFIRKNIDGKLYNTANGSVNGFANDPIEKKPLYHFYPGSTIYSFGTIGCNLGCKFCQNWHISMSVNQKYISKKYSAQDIVKSAQINNSIGIAYTYNEPIIFGEWVIDIADHAHNKGLKNVMVTNGYITPEARHDIFKNIDAVNVDLKSFSDQFYRKLTLSNLDPVLDTLRWLVNETNVWVEITALIIPEHNDDPYELRSLSKFIVDELDTCVPLHFSAFHPDFKMLDVLPTPIKTLKRACDIALDEGLKFVYIGNVFKDVGQDTICPSCGKIVIKRIGYRTHLIGMNENKCLYCDTTISGCFKNTIGQS